MQPFFWSNLVIVAKGCLGIFFGLQFPLERSSGLLGKAGNSRDFCEITATRSRFPEEKRGLSTNVSYVGYAYYYFSLQVLFQAILFFD